MTRDFSLALYVFLSVTFWSHLSGASAGNAGLKAVVELAGDIIAPAPYEEVDLSPLATGSFRLPARWPRF